MVKKIKSVIELSKYKIGRKLYLLSMYTGISNKLLSSDLQWMSHCHPKIFFTSGTYRYNTKSKYITPKLPSNIFSILSTLVASHFVIMTFEVTAIQRCENTGEFYYFDGIGEWHPESILMTTERKALSEKRRILSLVSDWVLKNHDD